MELMSKIGDYVKKWRAEKELSREDMAEKLFCNSETLRRWEVGLSDPTYNMIGMIFKVTGAKREDLF